MGVGGAEYYFLGEEKPIMATTKLMQAVAITRISKFAPPVSPKMIAIPSHIMAMIPAV